MLAPLDDPLPNCRLIATGAEFDDSADFAGDAGRRRVGEVTLAALDELAELMRTRSPRKGGPTATCAAPNGSRASGSST
jgi:hypothetical protein